MELNETYKHLVVGNGTSKADEYLGTKLKEAESLIRGIDYRKESLYKTACCIVECQSGFFESGSAFLRPLTMGMVSQLTGLSESTISRLVNGNYLQAPQGIYELRYFFQGSVACNDGGEVSQGVAMQRIRDLIADEDPGNPLSDQKLSELLGEEGVHVSRRTVNKYRDILKIPPRSVRRR